MINLALPEAPRVEHRDVSYARRPAHETTGELWREPDSKPVFTFMLRPRIIQEGIGCKLICCVSGKPQPKVIYFLFIKNNIDVFSFVIRYNGLKNVHNWVITIRIMRHPMCMVYAP